MNLSLGDERETVDGKTIEVVEIEERDNGSTVVRWE